MADVLECVLFLSSYHLGTLISRKTIQAEMQRTQLRNYRDNKIQRLECIIKPPHPHFFNKKAVTVPSLYNYRSLHYDIFAKGYYNSFIIFCISFMYPGISNP